MRSLGWPIIQYDCCPCKKRKFGHRHKGRNIRRHWTANYKPERGDWEGTNPVNTFIFDFYLLNLWENKFLLKPPSLWYFVMVALKNKCHLPLLLLRSWLSVLLILWKYHVFFCGDLNFSCCLLFPTFQRNNHWYDFSVLFHTCFVVGLESVSVLWYFRPLSIQMLILPYSFCPYL